MSNLAVIQCYGHWTHCNTRLCKTKAHTQRNAPAGSNQSKQNRHSAETCVFLQKNAAFGRHMAANRRTLLSGCRAQESKTLAIFLKMQTLSPTPRGTSEPKTPTPLPELPEPTEFITSSTGAKSTEISGFECAGSSCMLRAMPKCVSPQLKARSSKLVISNIYIS